MGFGGGGGRGMPSKLARDAVEQSHDTYREALKSGHCANGDPVSCH